MEEIWKDVPQFEGLYQVSNLGRVREIRFSHGIPKILKDFNNRGYRRIVLTINYRKKKFLIHRLVASAFVVNDDPLNKTQVNHKDGNKSNNIASNLEWVNNSENQIHAIKMGLRPRRQGNYITPRGALNKLSKPIQQFTLDGDLVCEYPCASYAAEVNDFSLDGIYRVCRGERNKYKGFVWKYK